MEPEIRLEDGVHVPELQVGHPKSPDFDAVEDVGSEFDAWPVPSGKKNHHKGEEADKGGG